MDQVFSTESPLVDAGLKAQLKPLFDKMDQPVTLRLLYAKDQEKSMEAGSFYLSLASLSEKIQTDFVEQAPDAALPEWAMGNPAMPLCGLFRADGGFTGVLFRGIPAGKEINSFILALLGAAGLPAVQLEAGLKQKLAGLKHPAHIRIMVSLGCSHCSKMVEVCQKIALASDKVVAEMIDATLFPDLIQEYNIKRVPLTLLGGENVLGEKTEEEVVDWLLSQDA